MTTIAYTSVSKDGLTFASQPLLVEENFNDLCRLAMAVHSNGAAISIQLTHAGKLTLQQLVTHAKRLLNCYA